MPKLSLFLRAALRFRSRCPACGFSYYWQITSPGTCDGCGYPQDDDA